MPAATRSCVDSRSIVAIAGFAADTISIITLRDTPQQHRHITYHDFIAIRQVEYASIEDSEVGVGRVRAAISLGVRAEGALGTQVVVESHAAEGREQAG